MLDSILCCFRSKREVHDIYTCADSDINTKIQSYVNGGGSLKSLASDYTRLAKKETKYADLGRFFKAIEIKQRYNDDLNHKKVSIIFAVYYWVIRFFANRDLEASQKIFLSIVSSLKKDPPLATSIVLQASQAGDAPFIRRLFDEGLKIDENVSFGFFSAAIEASSSDVVKLLDELKLPYNPDEFLSLFDQPSKEADEIFDYVLTHMDYDNWVFSKETLLERAVLNNRKDKVDTLSKRPKINLASSDYSSTALIDAIKIYNRKLEDSRVDVLEIIKLLLELNEIDVDQVDRAMNEIGANQVERKGFPPIYYVVKEGDETVLKLLLTRTTMLENWIFEAEDGTEIDLFELAVFTQTPNSNVLTTLLMKNSKWLDKITSCFHKALRLKNFKAAEALVGVFKNFNKSPKNEYLTKLLLEIAKSNFIGPEVLCIAQLLLADGADFSFQDNSNNCALDYAVKKGNQELVRAMFGTQKDPTNYAKYALIHADKPMVKFLTEFGANLNKALFDEISLPKPKDEIVSKFLDKGADIFAEFNKISIFESIFLKCLKNDAPSIEILKLFILNMKSTLAPNAFEKTKLALSERAKDNSALQKVINSNLTKTRFAN